jgi:hypothetical protein
MWPSCRYSLVRCLTWLDFLLHLSDHSSLHYIVEQWLHHPCLIHPLPQNVGLRLLTLVSLACCLCGLIWPSRQHNASSTSPLSLSSLMESTSAFTCHYWIVFPSPAFSTLDTALKWHELEVLTRCSQPTYLAKQIPSTICSYNFSLQTWNLTAAAVDVVTSVTQAAPRALLTCSRMYQRSQGRQLRRHPTATISPVLSAECVRSTRERQACHSSRRNW